MVETLTQIMGMMGMGVPDPKYMNRNVAYIISKPKLSDVNFVGNIGSIMVNPIPVLSHDIFPHCAPEKKGQ